MHEFFAGIREGMGAARVEGHAIRRWRLTWRVSERLSLGMKDGDLGGVHSPLEHEWARKGSFLAEWDTGELSRGNLDGSSLAGLPEILEAAWASRYRDDDGACFLGPGRYPQVPLDSPDVENLFAGDLPLLGITVREIREWGTAQGARNVSGGAGASRSIRGVATSEGLDVEEAATSFSFYGYLDGEISAGWSNRRVFSPAEIEERLRLPGALFRATRTDRPWSGRRETEVVLHPGVATAFLDHFVFGNLYGAAVFRGQSRWSLRDFEERRLLFREDIRLGVDPHVPYSPGSYLFTGEGVPTEAQDYIREGRLMRPILDLKYARKSGMPATTPPNSDESVVFEAEGTRSWSEHLAAMGEGVLVLGVLGMHTQDRARGDYSLAAPTCAILEGGGIAGKTRVTLNDNFLENLRSGTLRLVRFPFEPFPGIAFRTTVSPDKGE